MMLFHCKTVLGRVGMETKWCRDGWGWIQMLERAGGNRTEILFLYTEHTTNKQFAVLHYSNYNH